MLYVFTILFYICSFAFPALCCDPIINTHNVYQEFVIDNVCGIGKVVVPNEFKHEFKCLYNKCITEGSFACSEFEQYIVENLNLQHKPLIIKKIHNLLYCCNSQTSLYCCNSQTSELISLKELQVHLQTF